MSWEGEKYI